MRPFQQVDVFSAEPMRGNPVAVVFDAAGLSTEQMKNFTRWTNLSEATFLVPPAEPTADYGVRIFTQVGELPFAGHPTLGTCHAWLQAGGMPRDPERMVQECPAGLIPIRRIDGLLAFAAPPTTRSGPVEQTDLERIAGLLGIDVGEIVGGRPQRRGNAATAAQEITKRYGERIGLELVEAHRRVWQGPTHVCSVEVDARHARDVLLRLAFGRPLQAAELRHLCA